MVTFPYTVGQTILTKRSTSSALPKDWNFVNFCISYLAALEAAAELVLRTLFEETWSWPKLDIAGGSLGVGGKGCWGWFGFFLEFSATKKAPETCHVTKSTYHFPVCVPLSMHLHYLLTRYSSIKLFSCSSCSVSAPCSVSTCQKIDRQKQRWLKLISCVCPPKLQCKPFSVISWPSSHLPQPFCGSWLWHPCCENAARVPSGNFSLENLRLCLSSSVAVAAPLGLALP